MASCAPGADLQLVQLRSLPRARPDEVGPVLRDRLARTVRYLRVSLTDRCNYRCTYCMPEEGIQHVLREDVLTLEEVVRLVEAFAAWGVERVRLTGGEPTLRKNLPWLISELSRIPRADGEGAVSVTLTTNGHLLAEQAAGLASAGLSGITVSVDSLDPERFETITRRGDLAAVQAGIAAAMSAGLSPIKLNAVAVRGFNDDELGAMCTWAWSRDLHPRFIELMPMAEGRLYVPGQLMSAAEIRAEIARHLGAELVPDEAPGVRALGPARYWRVASGQWAGRVFGTIGAMTENFCDGCNRLRVSATGRIHGCLAHDDALDLRAALRTGDGARLETVVRAVLQGKRDGHAFALDGAGGPSKAMISIGG